MSFVYVLKSGNVEWYYVGSTEDLEVRVKTHNSGGVRSTKSKRPLTLVYYEKLDDITEARRREKQIKLQRILKEKIIKNLASSSNG
ncbi:MAG: GIY-YIG nuclease family protein [Candidatus Vogelbacteria bacterium]|nr:GIY-YIG nuclease family protein [Candidatus Vogelbacteria bacterium]